MRFIRPSWVAHGDSSPSSGTSSVSQGLTIFSLDVHPDDSRIATGGLDAKVRIWSTAPILQPELEDKEELAPKQLAVLGMHTGPVLCVRWTHSGRWLASGSDDSVILVWDLDPYVDIRGTWFENTPKLYTERVVGRYGAQTKSTKKAGEFSNVCLDMTRT
jgi:protein HIRA/HIR1